MTEKSWFSKIYLSCRLGPRFTDKKSVQLKSADLLCVFESITWNSGDLSEQGEEQLQGWRLVLSGAV